MKKVFREWKNTIFFGLLIIGVALVLRLTNLTSLPVFADEAIYIRWSQIMSAETDLRFLPLSDGKQPLFMWILMFLVNRFTDPLFIGRLVSVFSGLGTLVGLFALTYYLFGSKKAALVAALLWATSPFGVFFDRMALVDSLLTMFGVWTLFGGLVVARTQRLDAAIMTGFALGGALITKSPAIFFAFLLPTTWIATLWPDRKSKKVAKLVKLILLLLVTYGVAFAIHSIQRLGPNFHLLFSRTQDYVNPISHIWQSPTHPLFVNLTYIGRSFWVMGPSLVLVLALMAVVVNLKKYPKEILLLLAWFLVPIFLQAEYSKNFTARYVLFSVPILFTIAASVFLTKKDTVLKAALVVLVLVLVQSLNFDRLLITNLEAAPLLKEERSGYLEEWTAGGGIREAAQAIEALHRENPEEQILVGTEGFFGTLPDGLQIYLQDVPNVNVIGVGIDFRSVPTSLIESRNAGNKTLFLANDSRLLFEKDFESLGLKVLEAYPKPVRSKDLKQYTQHGPQDTLYLLELE